MSNFALLGKVDMTEIYLAEFLELLHITEKKALV